MLRIGLTGGIAAGKSTASARFRQRGALVVDHDELARRAVAPGSPALDEIAATFGDTVVSSGELNRPALAAIVFNDADALSKLNAIVHPQVFALSAAADDQARIDGVSVVVHDIPLLVESGQGSRDFDLVVTIAADEDVRAQRLVDSRGMTPNEARGRIAAQATDAERAEVADAVLEGGGPPESLRAQVDEFWDTRVSPSG